jgi:hypothetical protein
VLPGPSHADEPGAVQRGSLGRTKMVGHGGRLISPPDDLLCPVTPQNEALNLLPDIPSQRYTRRVPIPIYDTAPLPRGRADGFLQEAMAW